jgi:hypothetical protein
MRESEGHPRPHTLLCQEKICHFHARFKLMQRAAREGMTKFLEEEEVTFCLFRPLKVLQSCGSATLSQRKRHPKQSEGGNDYPSAALPLLP